MARCFCACHEYPGTYPPPCNVCGHHNDHGRYPGAVNMGWVPDGEDVGPLRIESGEKYVLREALAQIVGAFTSGIYCANCGEGIELCRCIIDLGRTALAGTRRCPHGHRGCCGHHDLEDVPVHDGAKCRS